jgi:hypothetical protein
MKKCIIMAIRKFFTKKKKKIPLHIKDWYPLFMDGKWDPDKYTLND